MQVKNGKAFARLNYDDAFLKAKTSDVSPWKEKPDQKYRTNFLVASKE